MRVPAVVGSFPEPFVHGFDGRRLPVRGECADPSTTACDEVFKTLGALGVPAAKGGLRMAQTEQTLRVVVGPWIAARDELALRLLEAGPARSGVYARPQRRRPPDRGARPRGRRPRRSGRARPRRRRPRRATSRRCGR
jgi:hypothetical protein